MLRLFSLGASTDAGRHTRPALTPDPDEAALLDSLGDAVLTADSHDRVTYANRAALELFGRGRDAMLGEDVLNLFARESAETVRFGQSAARDGLPQRYDAVLAGRREDERKVSVSAAPLTRDEAVLGTVLTLRDVTDALRAHQELARSEARYRHLFEDASDAIM